jgi:general secretion pathway protein G
MRKTLQTRPGSPDPNGFSLIELMVVLTMIVILASIAVPMYQSVILRAKEATLKENLHHLRSVIDQYTADRRAAPQTLNDLVDAGYFREIPEDPITEQSTTWQVEMGNTGLVPGQQETGVVDVHSGATGPSSEGTPYSDW